MTIKDIKTAINGRITENGGRVYASEIKEGYEKPAFFVAVTPLRVTRISPVYDDIEMSVQLHYESSTETEAECIDTANSVNEWFAEPIKVGERFVKPPDEISHTIDDSTVLYSEFTINTTVIHNESSYSEEIPKMENLELKIKKEE